MSELIMSEVATPSTPSTGKGKIFLPAQTVPTIAILDDAGVLGKMEFDGVGTFRYKPPTSWTPGITFGGGSTGMTFAINGRTGSYERFGKTIRASAWMELTAKGSSTGTALLTGLPVAAKNVAGFSQPTTITWGNLSGITGMVQGFVSPTGTSINLTYLGTGSPTGLTHAHFLDTTYIVLEISYEID